jgi:hypothetical protein
MMMIASFQPYHDYSLFIYIYVIRIMIMIIITCNIIIDYITITCNIIIYDYDRIYMIMITN